VHLSDLGITLIIFCYLIWMFITMIYLLQWKWLYCTVDFSSRRIHIFVYILGVRKKPENRLNRENWKKNNQKNRTEKKTRLNRLNFWKNRPVRFGFGFINKKPNRTEPKPTKNQKKNRAKPEKPSQTEKTEPKLRKPSQNRKNRAKPVWTGFCPKKPNRNRSVWPGFGSDSVFFSKKKISVWLLFLIKTEPNRKWSPLIYTIFVARAVLLARQNFFQIKRILLRKKTMIPS